MSTSPVVRQIRKATRKQFGTEQKIQIVVEGLCGEVPIKDLYRREGIAPTLYYKWSKAFLEAVRNGLTRDTLRDATSDEVHQLKLEKEDLKRALAEATLDSLRFKKRLGLYRHEQCASGLFDLRLGNPKDKGSKS